MMARGGYAQQRPVIMRQPPATAPGPPNRLSPRRIVSPSPRHNWRGQGGTGTTQEPSYSYQPQPTAQQSSPILQSTDGRRRLANANSTRSYEPVVRGSRSFEPNKLSSQHHASKPGLQVPNSARSALGHSNANTNVSTTKGIFSGRESQNSLGTRPLRDTS